MMARMLLRSSLLVLTMSTCSPETSTPREPLTAREQATNVGIAAKEAVDLSANVWATFVSTKREQCRAKALPTEEERDQCLGAAAIQLYPLLEEIKTLQLALYVSLGSSQGTEAEIVELTHRIRHKMDALYKILQDAGLLPLVAGITP